jgi:hypothetical protein
MDLAALKSLLFENLNLKLLSFAFALVLYAYVHGSQDAQKSLLLGVVAVTPPDSANRVLMTPLPAQLRVTLRGARSSLEELHADDIGGIQLDLRSGTESRITIEPGMIPVPPGLKVEQVFPPTIDLVWEDVIVRDVPVEVGLVGAPAPGFVVKGAPVADPAVVRVHGPKSEAIVVQRARADAFDVTGLIEGKYSRQLGVSPLPGRVTFDVHTVAASVEIGREVAERPFSRVPVAVLGHTNAKAQPAELDVRLLCPPEVVRALRPEQIVPRVQIAATTEHGSEAIPVQLAIDQCEVHLMPPTVIVRW